MNSRYPGFADVTTLKELKFWKKLPKYQQAQIWNFINYRMNDLVMMLLDYPQKSPYYKLAKLRALESISAVHDGGKPLEEVYPATIGTGCEPINGKGISCSSLYWGPTFLDELDILSKHVVTQSARKITSMPCMTIDEVEKELEERTKK